MTKQSVYRILCVDDEPVLSEVLDLVVTELDFPFELVVAGSADEVRRVLKDGEVSMAMLDVNMPELDGIELTREIVAAHPRVPILVYSADGERHREAAMAAGARAYLPKPFDLDELLAILREWLPGEAAEVA